MVHEIIWTENAKEDLKSIVDYLERIWSQAVAENFIKECYLRIELLKHYPFIGISSNKYKYVRKILITKHNALFYYIENKKIILLDFFDT